MNRRRRLTVLALALTSSLGCDSAADEAEQAAKKASEQAIEASKKKAGELAGDAEKLGKDAADASKKKAGELADQAVGASKKALDDAADAARTGAGDLFDDLTSDGELSKTAKSWLAAQSKEASEADITRIVTAGVQLAPVAMEASRVLAKAVDSQTVVEPIFQAVGDDPKKVDQAIDQMPRVEVIDDVTVGFRQVDQLDANQQVKERGYLVMWRHEDHLVGFVYRSKRSVDLDTLVAETPRLVELTQQALAD